MGYCDRTSHNINSTQWLSTTMSRVGEEVTSGQGLGAASSIFKYYGTELNKRRNELNLAVGENLLLVGRGKLITKGLSLVIGCAPKETL